MSWFTRIDRFGDTHLCYSQDQSNSCALACTKMIVFKVNKLRPGHATTTTEGAIETIYKKYDSEVVNVGIEGVYFDRMHYALNELKIGTWNFGSPPKHEIAAALIDKLKPDVLGAGPVNTVMRGLPIMLDIDWGGTGRHAVVLDTITKVPFSDTYYGAVCDPADGDVHIIGFEKGKVISYKGQRVTWSINFGGTASQSYAKGVTLQGVVDRFVYCSVPP